MGDAKSRWGTLTLDGGDASSLQFKYWLKPLYKQLQVLNIDKIYKLEVAKFVAKVNLNKLPVFCGNQLTIFKTLSSIHTYSTPSVSSKSFYVRRTSLVKTNQSLKISSVKIWNSLPRHIRDKVLTSSDKTSSKITKTLLFEIPYLFISEIIFYLYVYRNECLSVCLCVCLFFFRFLFFINFFFLICLNQNKTFLSVSKSYSRILYF